MLNQFYFQKCQGKISKINCAKRALKYKIPNPTQPTHTHTHRVKYKRAVPLAINNKKQPQSSNFTNKWKKARNLTYLAVGPQESVTELAQV